MKQKTKMCFNMTKKAKSYDVQLSSNKQTMAKKRRPGPKETSFTPIQVKSAFSGYKTDVGN